MRIVITGATGQVGRRLVALLRERGDAVTALSRDAERARAQLGAEVECVTADLEAPGAWTASLAGAGSVVHLAGEPVGAKRWSAQQKQKIRDSRVESTRTIVEAIGALPAGARPASLICASGTDYYPFALDDAFDDEAVTEADPPGESFLARVCRAWEQEAFAAEAHGLRVATMRTGLVLGGGGALDKLARPFKLFVGGRVGSGRQWMPWLHLDDAAGAYVAAVHDERYRGPINLVTDAARNADFSRALGEALRRPSWFPAPGFAVKAAAGELAEYVLAGRRVVPQKLRELGFPFRYPRLPDALAAALREA